MKENYQAPKLTVLGNVETLTQAFGGGDAGDTIEYNKKTFPGDGGSVDGVVVPKN